MFDAFKPSAKRLHIDIEAVRDTLRYLEGDLRQTGEYAKLADTLRTALAEIDRIDKSGPARSSRAVVGAHFRPIDL
jgi:hypothetical protein